MGDGSGDLGERVVVQALVLFLGEQAAAQGVADWWSGVTADSVQTELARLHGQGEFGAAEYTDGQVGVRIWNLTDSDIRCRWEDTDGSLTDTSIDVTASDRGAQPKHAAAMCAAGAGYRGMLWRAGCAQLSPGLKAGLNLEGGKPQMKWIVKSG